MRTFRIEEILATKLRALYTRRKGRDLYDLWLTLTKLTLDDQLIVEGLAHYMDSNPTATASYTPISPTSSPTPNSSTTSTTSPATSTDRSTGPPPSYLCIASGCAYETHPPRHPPCTSR